MPWPSFRSTRPGNKAAARGWCWPRCVAGATHSDGPCPEGDESQSAVPGSDDVHVSGSGAPPMADPGGYERVSLLGLPYIPGRPIWRSGGKLCPTVLHRTEADGGIPSHPALAVCCCLHPTAGRNPPACSSPRVPSCCLHLRSSSASAAAFTPAEAWSWWQESGEARLHRLQASGVPFVSFLFYSATGSPTSGTQKLKK